jgi:membrane-associated phospholipid phosphatase
MRNAMSRRRAGRTRRWSVKSLVEQVVLVALAALAYFGVRGLTQGSLAAAVDHAQDVLAVENAIGIAWEDFLQDLILRNDWLVAAANWVYIYGHWPVVIGVLVWLFVRHHDTYFTLRNAMFISGAIGLVVFMAFPTAPPRLVDLGLIDTVTEKSSSYRALQPPGLLNKYAAMPSLHFGWNLLVGVVIVRVTRRTLVRVFAVALPIAMAFAVVMTANHYVLDVIAGGIVALVGLALVVPVNRVLDATRSRVRW